MRKRYLITVAVVAIILAALAGWLHFRHQVEARQSKSAVKNVPSQNGQNSTPPKIDQKTQAGLQMLVSTMKNMGWKEIPPIQQQIQSAIDSKDTGAVIRAFHDAVYAPSSRMAQAIPALQSFLSDPDPWVRLQTAEDLYIAGNNSGEGALEALLQTDHPIRDYDGSDIRTHAAEVLEKYRERQAISALEDYCRKIDHLSVKNSGFEILDGLALTARNSLPDDLVKIIRNDSDPIYTIYNLSFVNPQLIRTDRKLLFWG